jgi:hypothetical protein
MRTFSYSWMPRGRKDLQTKPKLLWIGQTLPSPNAKATCSIKSTFAFSQFRPNFLLKRSSTELVEPGLGPNLYSRNPGMENGHNPCRANSGRSTDSSKGSSTDSRKVTDMTCSFGNCIDTGKYRESCSIGTDKDTSMNTARDMNIHIPVRNLDRNPDQQPMKCKSPRGQEVPYLV